MSGFGTMLSSGLNHLLAEAVQGFVTTILGWFAAVLDTPPYWRDSWATIPRTYFRDVAIVALGAIVALRVLNYTVLATGEDAEHPSTTIRRTIIAAFAVALVSSGYLINLMSQLATGGMHDLVQFGATPAAISAWSEQLLGAVTMQFAANLGIGISLFYTLVALILAIGLIVLLLQAQIRGVLIAFYSIIAPLAALSATGTDNWWSEGMFSVLLRELAVLFLTSVVQMVVISAVLNTALSSLANAVDIIKTLALMYVAIQVPKRLRPLFHAPATSGGGGGAVAQIAATAARVLMTIPA